MSIPSVRMSEAEAERVGRVRQLGHLGDQSVDTLVDQLDDSSWVVRRAVIEELSRLGNATVKPLCDALRQRRDNESRLAAIVDTLAASTTEVDNPMLELTRDPNPAVVADAAQVLGRRRSKRATSRLAELAQAANDNVAVSAIEALGQIGGKAAVDSLIRAARSGSFFRVFPAIDVLGRTGDPRAVAPLAELLDQTQYAQEAARALGRTGDPAALVPLLLLLGRPGNSVVRVAALAIVELQNTYVAQYGGAADTLDALVQNRANASSTRHVLAALAGGSAPEQEALCQVLGSLGSEESLLELGARLDGPERVARAAALALKKLGPAGATNLIAALKDGDSTRRRLVLDVLGTRGVSVDDLVPCLRDPDGTVRSRTCELLGRLGDRSAVAPLFELLADPNARVAQAAAGALHALGGELTEQLALQAAQNGDRRARREALRLIGYFGYASGLGVLKRAALDSDDQLSEIALLSLGFIEGPEARDFLFARATDASAKTRAAVMRSLGNMRLADVTATLLRGLEDPEPWVRYYAAQALGKLHAESAAERLAGLLDDPAGQVRVAAIEAMSALSSPFATSTLSAGARSADVDIRRACLMGLSNARAPALLPLVVEATHGADGATRLVAVSALAAFDAKEAAERLGELARSDPESSVRSAALSSLAERQGPDAADALIALLDDAALKPKAREALSAPRSGRVESISKALATADDELAALLTSALARMRTPEALAALAAALALPNPAARRAAVITAAAVNNGPLLEALQQRSRIESDPEVARVIASVLRV